MELKEYDVFISRKAGTCLKSIYIYIARRTSVTAAEKVKRELLKLVGSLRFQPRRFPRYRTYARTEKEVRYVQKWSYKIVYIIEGQRIRVLDFFHTSQHPSRMDE